MKLNIEFENIKEHFDKLNKDESHFATRNDICTPMDLVKEMVDSIPNSFWNRKNLKILDPCVGNGNFLAYINMKTDLKNLYFNEISDIRINNLKDYFGNKINLTNKDFLTFDENEKFDLIVANPPYAKFKDGKRVSKNHNLSREFIKKSLNMLNENGYLLYIVPDNWMSYSDINDLPLKTTENQILQINIHGPKKYFPTVGSTFTWFLLEKTNPKKPTLIKNYYKLVSEDYVEIFSKLNFIPLYYNETVKSIINKVIYKETEKYTVKTSSQIHHYTKKDFISTEESTDYPFRVIHTPSQTCYSSIKHVDHDLWKVFIPLTNQYKPFIDKDCGATQSIAYIPAKSKDEANKILKDISNEVYKFVVAITRYGNFNNVRVLQRMSKHDKIKLTNKEQELIKKFNEVYYGK